MFPLRQLLIHPQNNRIQNQGNRYRIDNLRQNDVHKIKANLETAPQQKEQAVADNIQCQITDCYQYKRQLNVLREENLPKASVYVADIHIQQGIKANYLSKKNIKQQTGKKTRCHAAFSASHKAIGGSQYNKQVWNDSTE